MASPPSANNLMERSNRSQDPLQCPRCSSSNTKFCYYNNYSLSQPRHFCKACKRYWTRGGTLRNVPVGGGCRKNKKLNKRQPPSSGGGDGISSTPATSTAAMKSSISAQPDTDQLSPTSNRINNPLFCIDFPFSAFNHQHQISDANPVFFGSSTFANSAPTSARMSSLLASAIQQPRISTNGVKDNDQTFSSLMPSYEDMEMVVGNGEIGKELNIVGGENCMLAWNSEQIDQQINSSDSSSLLWNANNVGAWFDPSNMGSSVPSLI